MKNKALTTESELIESKIYQIRGQCVMLDSDLAELYDVETKRLNEQVKRNIERFPASFMFQLTYTKKKTFEVAICDLKNRGCCPERNICEFNFWPARIPISASFRAFCQAAQCSQGRIGIAVFELADVGLGDSCFF
ncbi:hypothetical protein MASR1M12_12560 [Erysipelotrichia bacterium]